MPGGSENALQFAGADHGIDFRNILLNLVAEAFHQAAGYDQFLGTPCRLVPRHLEDGIDRFLLGTVDE